MVNQRVVSVIFDPANGGSLGVDQETLILNDSSDTVSWFPSSPFPSGSNLLIEFDEPLGPFQVIRSVNSQNLLAKGNTGVAPKSFSYRLYLLPDTQDPQPANLVKGGPFTIDNQCTRINPIPRLTVSVAQPGNELDLTPDPDPIALHQGDNVLLEISELPPGLLTTYRFPQGSDDLGPFPTYFATRQDDRRLYVATFGSAEVGPLSYHITVWDELGQLVASKDPSIDGLGKPPGT
jgi:hypothetical protein